MKQKGLAPILIVILIALGLGGYLLYQRQFKPAVAPQSTPQSSPITTISDETANWKKYTSPEFNPFYTDKQLDGVTPQNILEKLGGGYANSENIKQVKFSIMFPEEWKAGYDKKGQNGGEDTYGSGFTFNKDNLEIRIGRFYAPGGNSCDKEFAGYGNNFKDIKTNSMTLRRIKDFENTALPNGYISFTLCQEIGTSFTSNTSLGKITFTLPRDYNQKDLDLMDRIISTLQKI